MSSFKVAIMTDVGAKLMADSIIEGYKIEFVKMVIGSGEYEEEEKTAEALRIRTELKQKRQEVGFSSRLISDENEVLLKTLITNKELDVGYRMREIGIIAKKAGDAEEVLYSIAVAKEADYLPPKDNPVEIIQEYYTKVSNVENIVINVEMEVYALAEDMQKVLYPEYDEAEELSELESGRNIFKEFGKLKKAVSDLIGHIRDKVIHITSDERKLWNTVSDKVDKIEGKGLSANDYTTKEKDKLGGIEEGANNYVHPNTHPANIIVQDSTHRFVTDGEKDTWNETLDNAKDYSDSAYRQATGYTDQKIADLIGGAPETLDTLKEVADAIQANKDVSIALDAAIGKKADKTVLDTHTADSTIHITSAERTNWNDANTKKHTHSNKGVLDKITQALLDSWNAAYSHISDAVKHITAAERTLWNTVSNKVDKVSGKGLSSNDYTTTEKNKLAGIAANANNYTHPTTAGNKHIPSGGSSGQILRWSSDGTAAWGSDNNTTYSTATQSANGLLSVADKKKLDGIATNANNYTHPTTAGNKHIPSGGSSGQILRWSADGTAVWGSDNNTTYSNMTAATASTAGKAGLVPAPAVGKQASFLRGDGTWQVPTNTTYSTATQSTNGLLSAADKKKLDGIATGANKTTVDSALSSTSTNPVQNKVINSALNQKMHFQEVMEVGSTKIISGVSVGDILFVSPYGSGGTTVIVFVYSFTQILVTGFGGPQTSVKLCNNYVTITISNGEIVIKREGGINEVYIGWLHIGSK